VSPVTSKILEAGQIADWIIEQMEHTFISKLDGKCESSSYDMSGNTWRYFSRFSEKIRKKDKLVAAIENRNEFIHFDDSGLDDFDALILAKILRFKCDGAKLLDLNNNKLVGDMGVAHLSKHVLSSNTPVNLRSLFLSGCGVTDTGVEHMMPHLAHPEQSVHILELRKNEITDLGAEMLAKALGKPNFNTPQFSLFLNSNQQIGEEGVVSLAKAVIESQGRLKVMLKDSCPDLSQQDKDEVMRLTKNKIRF